MPKKNMTATFDHIVYDSLLKICYERRLENITFAQVLNEVLAKALNVPLDPATFRKARKPFEETDDGKEFVKRMNQAEAGYNMMKAQNRLFSLLNDDNIPEDIKARIKNTLEEK